MILSQCYYLVSNLPPFDFIKHNFVQIFTINFDTIFYGETNALYKNKFLIFFSFLLRHL